MKRVAGRLKSLRRNGSIRPDESSGRPQADAEGRARRRLETLHEQFPDRDDRIAQHLATLCEQAGVTAGRVLEIAAGRRRHDQYLPAGLEYLRLVPRGAAEAGLDDAAPPDDDLAPADPQDAATADGPTPAGPAGAPDGGADRAASAGVASDVEVLRADLSDCPELASGSFDAIVSVNVLERVREPWLAAKEISRLLRPGGFTYHSTVFSWRYHPAPHDYWRFTPEALTVLFEDLELMRADFDTLERWRNLLGRGAHRLEPDAFGGWRENWRVFYAGVKRDA